MDPAAILAAAGTSGNGGQAAEGQNQNTPPAGAPAGESSQNFDPASLAYGTQLPKRLLTPEVFAKLTTTGGNKLENLVDGYLSATEKLSLLESRKTVPGKDAKPEEIAAFWKDLGRPDTKDGYQFDRSGDFEKLPKLPGLDEFTADLYHRHNLPKDVAESLWKEQSKFTLNLLTQMQTQREADKTAATKELEKRWGRDYADKRIEFEKAFGEFFGEKSAKEFLASPLANDPDFIDKIAGLRKYMVNSAIHTGGTPGGANPWSDKDFNLTAQGKLIRENPELAKTLAAAAGKTLKL